MGFLDQTCPQCGAAARRGASFCPECGQTLPQTVFACAMCGQPVKGAAKFCGSCGAPIRSAADASAADAMYQWRRTPDEFARRIDAADLQELLQPGIVVELGTQALIFQGGKLAATVTEGVYDLRQPVDEAKAKGNAIWRELAQLIFGRRPHVPAPAAAILVDAGERRLTVRLRNIRTKEEIPVDVTAEVVVRLADPAALHLNLMKGRQSLLVEELSNLLEAESTNVVQSLIKRTAASQLHGNLDLKRTLETEIRNSAAPALQCNGLELVQLRFVEFSSEQYEGLQSRRAETGVAQQAQEDRERRAALNRRIRETLTQDKMDRFASAQELEAFIRQTEHELGMQDVVRQAEMEELKQTYDAKRQDADVARRHLLQKLDLEHDLEMLRIQRGDQDKELDHEIGQQRKALAARQEAEWQEAQHQQRVGDLQRQARTRDEEKDLELKEKKIRLAMEARRSKVALTDEEETKRMERDQKALDWEAKREAEKLRTLSEVEQVRLAADLKKAEALKDFTEDQILALMAKDSPHVAAALAERAKIQAEAGASAELRSLYERALAEKDASSDRIERLAGRALEAMERVAGGAAAGERERKEEVKEMSERSMDRMADVAAAKAGAAPAGAPDVICPQCRQPSPVGARFCDHCGRALLE